MKTTIIILSVCLLFIVGCSSTGYIEWDPYYGTDGLEIEFLDNAPPYEMYEKQEFPIGINLKNAGAYDITQGVLSIGVENDYMVTPSGDDTTFMINGRSQVNNYGEEENKIFYSYTKPLDILSQIHNSKVLVTACYSYENMLRTDVCIDPDIFDLGTGAKPCEIEDLSFSGQGGPLAVTYVKETLTLKKNSEDKVIPLFEITVENLGNGEVIDTYSLYDYCGSSAVYKDNFNVFYMNAYIGENKMTCTPGNPVKLKTGGDAKIVCTLEDGVEASNAAYTSVLSVDMVYGYATSISEEVTIMGMPQ